MVTVRLNATYFPAVEMISGVALALIVLYGGYQAIDGTHHGRDDRRLRGHAVVPVRTDPAALPALHHLPVRDGRPGEDLRAARRRADARRTPPTRSRSARSAGRDRLRGRLLQLPAPGRAEAASRGRRRRAARRRATVRPPPDPEPALALEHIDLRSRRADRRPGGGHRRREVHDGQAGRPLLRPDRGTGAGGRARPARGQERLAALADGDRAPGGLPLLRHGARQHRLRHAPRRRTSRSGRPPGRSAPTSSSPSCPTATTPRSASGEPSSRRGSDSCWPSPGR